MLTRSSQFRPDACSTACVPAGSYAAGTQAHGFSREIDRLFNEVLTGLGGEFVVPAALTKPFPALNICHDEHQIVVEAELPGFTMEQIDINLSGRDLTLRVQRETDSSTSNATFVSRERASGSFSRSVRLPVNVDPQAVSATLTDGVLTITLPKAPEAKPRKIAVNAG